ncbi:type 2 lanthipeptide synthetase LanM family protein [Streptomyces afghaniensis]|uniref:type 2 lanthipeptide synthetase LanM family protein n=1 Tax=Streptomyces afghaniensis TaxID=66865 RepID=UPI00278AC1DE|nr:type 2 lanthipeptide synthetase LanM family protein [Streptomyces afghaniensis]MDQ1014230.1 type 2 lantibiotic biosynthesis protein LanM [Streptomyces afghaniensis]
MTDSHPGSGSVAVPEAFTLPWVRAATMAERTGGVLPTADTDRERGERRFGHWRRMVPFRGTDREIDANLSPFGVRADELAGLLGEPPESLRARLSGEPSWSRTFTAAWRAYRPGGDTLGREDDTDQLGNDLAFLEICRPLLVEARARLREDLAELAAPLAATPELAALPEILANTLPLTRLGDSVQRMCVLELNVARVERRLAGATPQERFRSFLGLLRDPDYALALWREYPTLARYQVDLLDSWRAARVEFARHLLDDFSSLVDEVWDGCRPGALEAVEFGAGDTHRGGRSVAVVRFAGAQVMYKPRTLAGDVAFNRCLEWFNGLRPPHRMRMPRVLSGADHGWVEFIEHEVCASAEDFSAFYWRAGALLALLHSLNAADFHLENVVAAGDCPVAVDLETLFHTYLNDADHRVNAADPAATALGASVLSVGLLPLPCTVFDADTNQLRVVDLSGLGADDSVPSSAPFPVVEGADTDEMRIVRKYVTFRGAANRPRLADGTKPDPLRYCDQVVDGFTFTYQNIRRDRAGFLRPGGLIDGFLEAQMRVILRPTQTYGRLLDESTHPDFLRDALDRDRSLARLCQGLDDCPGRYQLMAAEIQALRRADFPIFTVRPASRDVWLDDGTRVPDVLATPPAETVRLRIERMGDQDLGFQLRMIRDSYASVRLAREPVTRPATSRPLPPRAVGEGELVELAEDVGRRLLDLAVRDHDRIGWPGLGFTDEQRWEIAPAGSTLYQGLPGVGMLLLYLAAETGGSVYADHAGLAARTAAAQLEILLEARERRRPGSAAGDATGFFGAIAGPVTFLLHAGHVLGDAESLMSVRRTLPVLDELLQHDRTYDVIGGNAGLLLTMLAVHDVLPDAGALRIAQSAAEHLIAHRTPTEHGTAWLGAPEFGTTPLGGMSHGAAGIALALARLHRITGDRRLAKAIESALAHENALYDPDAGNWRDLRARPEGTGTAATCAWCHGAAGIGLARLEMLSCGLPGHLRPILERDLRRASRATWRVMVGPDGYTGLGNHSICHGDMGNVELLTAGPLSWRAADAEPPLAPERVIAAIVADARQRGWRCGVPAGSETVGLMPGLAGIGYQLLHLARPDRVPSILRMRPPVV